MKIKQNLVIYSLWEGLFAPVFIMILINEEAIEHSHSMLFSLTVYLIINAIIAVYITPEPFKYKNSTVYSSRYQSLSRYDPEHRFQPEYDLNKFQSKEETQKYVLNIIIGGGALLILYAVYSAGHTFTTIFEGHDFERKLSTIGLVLFGLGMGGRSIMINRSIVDLLAKQKGQKT